MELLVIVISLSLTGAQESRLEGPENTLGAVGSTVTLKCLSPSRHCSGIDWQKYVRGASPVTIFKGPGTILNSSVVDRDRYSVDNSSGCDLVIKNVQLTDAGRFICSAIMSTSQTTKSAYLIVLETQPKCTLNVSLSDAVEGDGVQLKCEVTYIGANKASMNWKRVTDAPAAVIVWNRTISRSYSVVASAPEVPSFTCEASFAYEEVYNYNYWIPVEGLATNRIPAASCGTPVITIFHSVRNVTLSPSLSNYPPGTIVTCMGMGYPPPTFKWQEMENERSWTDIQKQTSSKFTVTEVSIKRYRCVAMNVVRGKSYNATSHEILVNSIGIGFGIGFGIGLLVAILLATVVFAILIKVRCLEVHPMPVKKSPGGDTQNVDQEMKPSSRQRSPKTEDPLSGEQESAYACLGEDRDANEYASIEQRQNKGEAKEIAK